MVSAGNNRQLPPSKTEIEVSIFGPGFGECIVLHFGQGDWGIVDSCLDPISKRAAALQYLEDLGVESGNIRIVVATHWHDDHIRGIGSVFLAAKSAVFSCSAAIREGEFNEVMANWTGTRFLSGGSGVDELRGVLAELKTRQRNTNYPSARLAIANRSIWTRSEPFSVKLEAVSPSDVSVVSAMARLKHSAPKLRRRIPDIQPNDASVVLSLDVGGHRVLLGADLEVQQDVGLGWSAVVSDFGDQQRFGGFKVPHHGSPTGYHDGVWNNMLTARSWATTTPFVSGRLRLPSVIDCTRIVSRTPSAYLTAPPNPGKFRDPNRTVEKTVVEATNWVHLVPGKYGHVRLRKHVDEAVHTDWRVEFFGNALRMSDYVDAIAPD